MMRRILTALAVCLFAAACTPTLSRACVLNNQSSLSANGYAAVKDLGTGTIMFDFERVYGRDGTIQFSENLADLRQSLSSAEVAHPFLWRWGDGTYSIARAPSHIYRRLGTFQIAIYAFGTAEGEGWSPFDRARVTIVPAGEVWRDNLGYTVLDVVGFTLHWAVRLGLAALALIVAYGFWDDRQRSRRRQRTSLKLPHPAHSRRSGTE
jgi:hypothetical protein